MLNDQDQTDRTAVIAKAWRNWLLMFAPLFALTEVLTFWLGFYVVLPWLIALLIAVLLYQRFVNKRTWRSIMCGVHVSDK